MKKTISGNICDWCDENIPDEDESFGDANGTILCGSCHENAYSCEYCDSWVESGESCSCGEEEEEAKQEEEEAEEGEIFSPTYIYAGDTVKLKNPFIHPSTGWGDKKLEELAPSITAQVHYIKGNNVCCYWDYDGAYSLNKGTTWQGSACELEVVKKTHPDFWYVPIAQLPKGICVFCGGTFGIALSCNYLAQGVPHCGICCPHPQPSTLKNCPPHFLTTLTGAPDTTIYGANYFQPAQTIFLTTVLYYWGIDRTLNLSQLAADFYLLLDLECDFPADAAIRQPLREITALLEEQFSNYLNMIIGGELRHLKVTNMVGAKEDTITNLLLSYYPPGAKVERARYLEWYCWKAFQNAAGVVPALECASKLFKGLRWAGSYGGTKWATITNTLLMYLKEETTPRTFVDTVWGLKHNNSLVFDKAYPNLNGLMEVLESNLQSNLVHIANNYASLRIARLWKSRNPDKIIVEGIEKWDIGTATLNNGLTPIVMAPSSHINHATTSESPSPSAKIKST